MYLFKVRDTCCDRIGMSSTTNNGHGSLGSYEKEGTVTDGRYQYVKTGGNGGFSPAYLYWHVNGMWLVSIRNPSLEVSLVYFMRFVCV
jgi:hypothetical protein